LQALDHEFYGLCSRLGCLIGSEPEVRCTATLSTWDRVLAYSHSVTRDEVIFVSGTHSDATLLLLPMPVQISAFDAIDLRCHLVNEHAFGMFSIFSIIWLMIGNRFMEKVSRRPKSSSGQTERRGSLSCLNAQLSRTDISPRWSWFPVT